MDVANDFLEKHITLEKYCEWLQSIHGGKWDKRKLSVYEANWKRAGIVIPKRIVKSREKSYYLLEEVKTFINTKSTVAEKKTSTKKLTEKQVDKATAKGARKRRTKLPNVKYEGA